LFGRSERLERRADDLNGGPVLINRTPGGYEAGIALKAGTAAALITDYERKAVAGRIPCLDLLDGSNHATELHDATRITAPRHQVMELRRMCDGDSAQLRRISDRAQLRRAKPAVLADLLDILNHRVDRGHDAAYHRRLVKEDIAARHRGNVSAFHPKADIPKLPRYVRFGPILLKNSV